MICYFDQHDTSEPKSPDFDQIERTAMLSHPTASRAKAPRRRPPSAAFSVPSEDDPALDSPPINGIPGVDKEKAPWVQELKMNQAKKSTSNSVIGVYVTFKWCISDIIFRKHVVMYFGNSSVEILGGLIVQHINTKTERL